MTNWSFSHSFFLAAGLLLLPFGQSELAGGQPRLSQDASSGERSMKQGAFEQRLVALTEEYESKCVKQGRRPESQAQSTWLEENLADLDIEKLTASELRLLAPLVRGTEHNTQLIARCEQLAKGDDVAAAAALCILAIDEINNNNERADRFSKAIRHPAFGVMLKELHVSTRLYASDPAWSTVLFAGLLPDNDLRALEPAWRAIMQELLRDDDAQFADHVDSLAFRFTIWHERLSEEFTQECSRELARFSRALPHEGNASVIDRLTEAANQLARKQILGKPAPELDILWDSENAGFKAIADLKGKVLLLEFWSTACAPCIQEFPALRELQAHYAQKDFLVLGVTSLQGVHYDPELGAVDCREDPEKEMELMRRFMAQREMTWPVVFTEQSCYNAEYGAVANPFKVLIDAKGAVRAVNAKGVWHSMQDGSPVLRFDNLHESIDELLAAARRDEVSPDTDCAPNRGTTADARAENNSLADGDELAWTRHMTAEQFQVLADADGLAPKLAGDYESADGSTRVRLNAFQGLLAGEIIAGPNEGFIAFAEPVLDERAVQIREQAERVMDAMILGDDESVHEIAGDRWFWQIGTTLGRDYLKKGLRDAVEGRDLESHRLVAVRRKPEWSDHGFSSNGWVYETIFELQFTNGEHTAFRIGWDPSDLFPKGTGQDSADLYATRKLIFLPQRAASWAGFDALNDLVVRLSWVDESAGVDRKSIHDNAPVRLSLGGTELRRMGKVPVTGDSTPKFPAKIENVYDLREWTFSDSASNPSFAKADFGRTHPNSLYLEALPDCAATMSHDVNLDVEFEMSVKVKQAGKLLIGARNKASEWRGVEVSQGSLLVQSETRPGNAKKIPLVDEEWLPIKLLKQRNRVIVSVQVQGQWTECLVSENVAADWEFGFTISGEGAFIQSFRTISHPPISNRE